MDLILLSAVPHSPVPEDYLARCRGDTRRVMVPWVLIVRAVSQAMSKATSLKQYIKIDQNATFMLYNLLSPPS